MAGHAYDLSAFEEKKPTVVALQPNKKAQRAQVRQHRAQSALNVLATVLTTAVALGVVIMMIVSRVRITQINNQIAEMETQIGILQSESVRLKGEIAANASPESVEEYAKLHGMTKVDPSQIRYFSVNDTDAAEIPENDNDNVFVVIWDAIVGIFS